jgi:hypothetical protein
VLSELLVDPLGLVEVAQPKSELSIAYEQLYGDLRLSLIKNSSQLRIGKVCPPF